MGVVCVCVGGDLLASNIHGYRVYFHWEMVTVMKRVMVVYSMYSKHIYGIQCTYVYTCCTGYYVRLLI